MRKRTIGGIAVFALAAVFLFLNWRVFAAPVSLSFFFGRLDIPIGLVMLAVFLVMGATFGIFMGLWQNSFLREYRRQTKELESQRALADRAEASRFTELSALIRNELAALDQKLKTSLEELGTEVRDTENAIAATLGEMDDRIRRVTAHLPVAR